MYGAAGEAIDVEESAMEAMRTGLQCSHVAADTVFSQTKALTGAFSLHTPAALLIRVYSLAPINDICTVKLRLTWHTRAAAGTCYWPQLAPPLYSSNPPA